MEAQSNHWLPLTEYALRSGMSISTLRRKIKSNTIDYKMEEGRYLIRGDDLIEEKIFSGFASSDAASPRVPTSRPIVAEREVIHSPPSAAPVNNVPAFSAPKVNADSGDELAMLREDFRRMQEDNLLRWRALEARVSGLAKKLELFSEQMAEAKMLVKIFEEKLDHRA